MDWDRNVVTAGAFVWSQGRLVFMVGPTRAGDKLGVVRLGGHREAGESTEACAVREVMEEAAMAIRLLPAPATYFAGSPAKLPGEPLPTIDWPGSPRPVLVTERQDGGLAVLYLAVSDDPPVPSNESEGLLLPDRAWLERLTARRYTLAEYLAGGGQAVLRTQMEPGLVLEPSHQLRLFARLLAVHAGLVPA